MLPYSHWKGYTFWLYGSVNKKWNLFDCMDGVWAIICSRLYGCLLISQRKTWWSDGVWWVTEQRKIFSTRFLEKILTHQYFMLPYSHWKGYTFGCMEVFWIARNGIYLTVWMEFGQCGLLPKQETLMGMELFGDWCMDYWSFVYERTVVRAEIFPKKIVSLANSSKLRGKWNHLAILRYCV